MGNDIKAARQVLNLSRKELAEMVNIVPRYLANIENSGSLPSFPVFYQLVKICKLPVKRYFFPEAGEQDDPERQRTAPLFSRLSGGLETKGNKLASRATVTTVAHFMDFTLRSNP